MPPQNTALAERPQKQSLSVLLKEDRYANRFKDVMGSKAPLFVSSLLQLGSTMEDVEPHSIIAAAMTAASLDLPINKSLGFAWIVPYATGRGNDRKKLAQFQLGAKGYIQLALRSAQYRHLNVCTVYDGELVKHDKMRAIVEIDATKRKPGKEGQVAIGFCGFLTLTNGFEHAEYWTAEEVDAHAREYSQAYRYSLKETKKDSMWETDFESMAHKTVISMLLRKWGIMSIDMQRAVKHDHGVQIDVDSEVTYIDNQLAGPEAKPAAQVEGPQTEPKPAGKTFENPNAEIAARLKRDNISEAQVLSVLKQAEIAGADAAEVYQLSDAKLNQVLNAWDSLLPQFRAATV